MLVGRDRELEELDAATAGAGAVALLGPFGVGKSALVRELARRRPGTLVGQTLPALATNAYRPLLHAAGRPPSFHDAGAVADLVRDRVGAHGLLVVEDLQWADPGTLEVLVELHHDTPVLVTIQDGVQGADAARRLVESLSGDVHRLGPLDPPATDELLRRTHPGLLEGERRHLVARSGGNPLIVSVLARSGPDGPGELVGDHWAIVTAYVDRQPPESRETLAMLSLSPGPLQSDGLQGLDELTAAGLVELDGAGGVRLRHRVFGRAADEALDDERRRAVRERVAGLPCLPGGLRAELELAAGRAREAHLHAMATATGPVPRSEQAAALLVAVRAAAALAEAGDAHAPVPEERHELRLSAARALNDSGEHAAAAEVLDAPGAGAADGDLRTVVEQLRAALGRGSRSYAEQVLRHSGHVLDAEHDGPELARARALRAMLARWSGDPVALEVAAREQFEMAKAGAERSHAAMLVGLAAYRTDVQRLADWFHVAREEAGRGGELVPELAAARNLALAQMSFGRQDEARAVCDESIAKADAAGEVAWSAEFAALLALGRNHDGSADDDVLAELSLMRTAPLRPDTRAGITAALAALLADRGFDQRSAEVLAPWSEPGFLEGAEPMVHALVAWGDAQRSWVLGELERTVRTARRATEALPHGYPTLAGTQVVWRWAEYELGVPVTAPTPAGGFMECARLEATGIDLLVAGREAVEQFREAAESWRPVLRRAELRCRWAAGHSAALTGDEALAAQLLGTLDAELDRWGCPALRPRVRASLRRAGGSATAGTGPNGEEAAAGTEPVSRREAEILALVGDGCTSAQIAHRLGISVATVNTHVASAVRKLGVRTRVEAVSRLRALQQGS